VLHGHERSLRRGSRQRVAQQLKLRVGQKSPACHARKEAMEFLREGSFCQRGWRQGKTGCCCTRSGGSLLGVAKCVCGSGETLSICRKIEVTGFVFRLMSQENRRALVLPIVDLAELGGTSRADPMGRLGLESLT